MAFMVDDQQPNFKHFCKICKKGFMCGRALGGHMRAHGLSDEGGILDDEDPESDWEDRENAPGNKRMYALRTNPNRLKSCRACQNCGKEFVSWKSFLEHGKCNSGDGESPESSPESDGEEKRGCHQWSKRKRSLRTKVGSFSSKCPSSEEDDIAATCLVMLSNARVDVMAADQPEESCASASREEERRNPAPTFIVPLSTRAPLDKAKGVAKGMFECKACKKVFNSHQALGGHRASHKKVKGCFAARLDHESNEDDVITHEDFFIPSKSTSSTLPLECEQNSSKRKSKVHECSICHRIFSSGQALGGHKRCHWITANSLETSKIFHPYHHDQMLDQQIHDISKWINKSDPLDLNLPVPPLGDDIAGIRRDPRNPLSFEVSTEINLQSWADAEAPEGKNYTHPVVENNSNKIDEAKNTVSMQNREEDEADGKVKLAKLSEMKDMNISGSSSPWLQVGIGSTTTGVGPENS